MEADSRRNNKKKKEKKGGLHSENGEQPPGELDKQPRTLGRYGIK
jgi:hypothetical protein